KWRCAARPGVRSTAWSAIPDRGFDIGQMKFREVGLRVLRRADRMRLANLLQQGSHRTRIAPLRVVTLRFDPWGQLLLETDRQQILLFRRHGAEDFAEFGHLIRREVDGLGEPACKPGIARDEAMHLGWIAGDDDDHAIAMILHVLEERLDGL